ncbi:MAG TPA: DNA polymerase III subunit gamma/tau [candidate division Zixibacteria bacterium]|nr:DNA polymerase III subunit gamma/tau [candidate division Zixibacteria bacterium]
MSYLVFARKYRPQRFEDVVAQDHVTRTLQNAVKNDRVASGYLFCGPRGTGKTTTARILAKALNCEQGPTPTPCGECSSCREIASGTSMDVLEIDAASNTGVDDIRTLRENVRYLPASGQKRIYIIDEVHRLSGAAFDALLKTLEEPPPHVLFIFATTEPSKVPETILSRTQRYDFKRVSAADLAGHLRKIADAEGLQITDAALGILARKADGSVRDSLSLMDQIAAYAGETIDQDEVINALGLVDRQLLLDYTRAIASHDTRSSLGHIKAVVDSGTDTRDFVTELLEHFRTLMIIKATESTDSLNDLNNDERAALKEQADFFQLGDLVRLTKIGSDLLGDLKRSGLDQRLLLEVAAIRMAEMESTVRFEDILGYLKQGAPPVTAQPSNNLFGQAEKKKNTADSRPVTQLRRPPETLESLPPATLTYPVRNINLPTVQLGWKNFLGFLRQKNVMLASQLSMAEVQTVEQNRLKAVFGSSGCAAKQVVERPDNLSLIIACLREHYGANLSIAFDIDRTLQQEEPITTDPDHPKIKVSDLIKQSPRIRKLMDLVDGEIIGVKNVVKFYRGRQGERHERWHGQYDEAGSANAGQNGENPG